MINIALVACFNHAYFIFIKKYLQSVLINKKCLFTILDYVVVGGVQWHYLTKPVHTNTSRLRRNEPMISLL